MKIRVPRILDHPILGRIIAPMLFPFNIPLGLLRDYIIIENGILTYKGSITSSGPSESFNLKNITKILLEKRNVTCFTKDGKLDFWGRLGTEMELFLVDIAGERHVLIPKIIIYNYNPSNLGLYIGRAPKEWDRFLSKLIECSGVPLEEITYYTEQKTDEPKM